MTLLRTFKIFTLLALLLGCGVPPPINAATKGKTIDSSKSQSAAFTMQLRVGESKSLADNTLNVKLVDTKDSRCPSGAYCIWAGHASATLLVTHKGAAPETVQVGTLAPPEMKLPGAVVTGGYRLSLQSMEPPHDPKANTKPPAVTVTLLIEKI